MGVNLKFLKTNNITGCTHCTLGTTDLDILGIIKRKYTLGILWSGVGIHALIGKLGITKKIWNINLKDLE